MCVHVRRFLRPALEDDALLLSLEELLLQGDNQDDEDDGSPATTTTAPESGAEEQKGSVFDYATTAASGAGEGAAMTGPSPVTSGEPAERGSTLDVSATAAARISELELENARLREALQAADERMAGANRVLRSLAVGDAEGGEGSDGEGSVAGVSIVIASCRGFVGVFLAGYGVGGASSTAVW